MNLKILSLLIVTAFYSGCGEHTHDLEEHHHEANSVTIWTDSTELFMEYPPLVAGKEAAFAVHLSNMKNFTPITEGSLELIFTDRNSGFPPDQRGVYQ